MIIWQIKNLNLVIFNFWILGNNLVIIWNFWIDYLEQIIIMKSKNTIFVGISLYYLKFKKWFVQLFEWLSEKWEFTFCAFVVLNWLLVENIFLVICGFCSYLWIICIILLIICRFFNDLLIIPNCSLVISWSFAAHLLFIKLLMAILGGVILLILAIFCNTLQLLNWQFQRRIIIFLQTLKVKFSLEVQSWVS